MSEPAPAIAGPSESTVTPAGDEDAIMAEQDGLEHDRAESEQQTVSTPSLHKAHKRPRDDDYPEEPPLKTLRVNEGGTRTTTRANVSHFPYFYLIHILRVFRSAACYGTGT